MIILAFDPGTVSTGWAYSNNGVIIDCNKIRSVTSWSQSKRLGHLLRECNKLIELINPDEIRIEQQFVGKNAKTSLITARAFGIIVAIAGAKGIKCVAKAPSEIKFSVTGIGNSPKDIIAETLKLLYDDNKVIQNIGEFKDKGKDKTDDIYDAVAILHDALNSYSEGEIV